MSQFNQGFIESHNEENHEGYFFEVDINIQKNHMNSITIYKFYQKE